MVTINTDVIEMMLFFWQSTSEKEKVNDIYLNEIAARDEMKILYNDEFNPESVRKVLSAITNRELLSKKTQEEGRFWNNNMWILDDLSLVTKFMLPPVKTLNADIFTEVANGKDLEIIFIPGTFDTFKYQAGKLYINFFKLMTNPYALDEAEVTEEVSIEGQPFIDFIKAKITELL